MTPPPARLFIGALGSLLFAGVLFVAPAAAQQQPPDVHPFIRAIGSMLSTLIIGGGFILLKPDYTNRTTAHVRSRPGTAFLYGFVISVLILIVVVLLAITIVGLLLVVPIILALVVVAELGFLAAGRTLAADWTVALFAAALVGGLTGGIPILGSVVGFVLGTMGLGAAYMDWTHSTREGY